MTQSLNDNEVLIAIRKANQYLQEHDLQWNDVINNKQSKNICVNEVSIFDAFTFIYENLDLWANFDRSFVDSLLTKYKNQGMLSDRETIGLMNIYKRFRYLAN